MSTREIKFRQWREETREFEYWGLLDTDSSFPDTFTNRPTWDGIPLDTPDEQYTGLKDKNGTEIYEGDILGLVHKKHGMLNSKVVVWDEVNACFDWEDANGDSWPDGFTGFYDEYSVIGNIYENKELLK